MIQASEKILPWYRQFWFWFVFGPLIFIIVLCGFTVSIAFHYADDVVTDNYYKSGLMINQTFKQDEKAEDLNLEAIVKFDRVTGEILITLKGNHSSPKNISLFLDNPVKLKKDQVILLSEVSAGEYRGELKTAVDYSWYLAIVPEADASKRKTADWLLSGDINLAKTAETTLRPRKHVKPAE